MTIPDLGSDLPSVILRTAIVYVCLVLGFRFLGKREAGQLSTLDLVVLLVIANAVQNAMVGPDASLDGGLVAAVTLLVLNLIVIRSITRSSLWERVFEGEPTLLVKDGAYLEKSIRREGLAQEEVDMAVREHGIDSVSDVRVAYLEPDGTISVIPIDAQVLRGRRKVKRIRQFKRGTG